MSQLDHGSSVSNDNNDNDDSYNQIQLQNLKQEITLSNVQLLELTYNDQMFFEKLSELNQIGCEFIAKLKYHEALIYLSQAQKILEYAASCGKTIQRSLIITTLNNQASLYQRAWELQKAASYIQAIIYNISSFFQGNSTFTFTKNILDQQSIQNQEFSIFIGRKLSLSLYFLQFCAINSQNKNHENAFSSAFKAVNMLKQICSDLFKYEQYVTKNEHEEKLIGQQSKIQPYKMILYELANLKQLDQNNLTLSFQKYYQNTLKHMAGYIKRTKQDLAQSTNSNYNDIYKEKFANYSIGYLMQINPLKIQRNQDKISIKDELSDVKKIFKSVYISVGFFILATELRFISSQKYTLDQNQRKKSIQYKQSQIYHLLSIIVASKYLPCESVYFEHIVNSFRNHYKIDVLQDAKKYILQQNQNINHNKSSSQIYRQSSQNSNKNHQDQHNFYKNPNSNYLNQIQEIQKLQITKKESKYNKIQSKELNHDTQALNNLHKNSSSSVSSEKQRERYLLTEQEQQEHKAKPLQNYNLHFSKKVKTKINKNKLTKSQHKIYQSNKIAQSTHKHQKTKKINLQYVTSRQKQNKIKNKLSNHSSKKSRQLSTHNTLSRKKSQTQGLNQLMTNTKRTNEDSNENKHYLNIQNVNKNNEYYQTTKSRSKTKRTGDGQKKSKSKRKQSASAYELRKRKKSDQITNKKVQLDEDYGLTQKRNQNFKVTQNLKKSNNNLIKKNTLHEANKLGSPTLEMKKNTIKSPKNLKKSNSHTSRERLFF